MIKLSIDKASLTNFNDELTMKIESIGMMKKQQYLEQVSKAAFTIVGEKFMLATDRYSVQNPKKMHHVYEWGQIGNPRARLFILQRSAILGGTVITNPRFLFSKVPVPIDPELLIPGATGRYVNRRSIFKNKAQVMENNLPISYHAQRALAFMGKAGINFVRPGTLIQIRNPGGVATKNAFSQWMLDWYNRNAEMVMASSGLYEKIVNETSLVISQNKSTPSDVLKVVTNISNSVSGGKVEIK
jgi:hypothetical protein